MVILHPPGSSRLMLSISKSLTSSNCKVLFALQSHILTDSGIRMCKFGGRHSSAHHAPHKFSLPGASQPSRFFWKAGQRSPLVWDPQSHVHTLVPYLASPSQPQTRKILFFFFSNLKVKGKPLPHPNILPKPRIFLAPLNVWAFGAQEQVIYSMLLLFG